MLKLVVLAAFIAFGGAAVTKLGEKRCTWGPTYWCDKYSNAIKCNAIEHCKTHVWKDALKSSDCDTCKEVLQYMHTILANNLTQGLLIDGLEEICNILPSSYKTECTGLITTYGTEIIQVIAAYTSNPNELCSLMGLCTASIPLVNMKEDLNVPMLSRAPFFGPGPVVLPKPKVAGSAECIVCEFAMDKLEGILTSKSTLAEIENAVDSLCNILPSSIKNECVAFVNTYSSQIIQLLVKEASPKEICTLIHACSSSVKVVKIQSKPIKSSVTCQVCEYAMGYLDKMLESNSTEQEVVAALESLCNYLPASIKGECDALVEQYGGEIVKLIIQELASPATVCKELGLCSSTGIKLTKSVVKIPIKSSIQCEVCEYAMGYLDKMIDSNSTEQEVVAALESLCNYLPASIKGECDALVKQYGGEIVKLIIQELASPAIVCKELGLCSSTSVKSTKSVSKPIESAISCEICTLAIQYLDSTIENNRTEAAVRSALDSLCNYLPSSYSSECTHLVKQYTDQIVKLIVDDLESPAVICKALGLCSSSNVKSTKPVLLKRQGVKAGEFCQICEIAMGYLKNQLSSNATEKEIITALETVCNYVPASFKGECDTLIEQYGREIITLLLSELNPEVVCKELGLCTSSRQMLIKLSAVPSKVISNVDGGQFCEVCELAMNYIKTTLSSKSTEDEIVNAVKSICTYLPSGFATECNALLTEYGDQIIKTLLTEFNPDTICKELSLCTSKTSKLLTKLSKPMLRRNKFIGSGVTCEICTVAMGYLKTMLSSQATEEEIVKTVEGLCTYLPSSVQSECDGLIEQYGKMIINLIVSEVTPDQVCKSIGLCSAARVMLH